MKKTIIPILILSLSFAFDAGTKSVGGGVNFVMDINTQEYSYDMMGIAIVSLLVVNIILFASILIKGCL